LIWLIAEAQLPSDQERLAFEAQLHQQPDQWCNPETKIVCFTPDKVEQVMAALTPTTTCTVATNSRY